MRIAAPTVRDAGGTTTWQAEVAFDDGTAKSLRYELPGEHRDLLSDRLDAALVALLIPAMRRGQDVHLDGPVTDRLLHQINRGYQRILITMIPALHEVGVTAAQALPPSPQADGVATGFSAGVDSFCVLADNYLGEVPDGLRVTHLLFHNVGSHGGGGEQLFRNRYDRAKPLAAEWGLPFIPINSNLDEFYTLSFKQTHTPRNASVALLLQGGIGTFLYASAYPYSDVGVFETDSMAYADAIALPLLSTQSLRLESDGSEYTRVGKTMRVAEFEASYRALDVCVSSEAMAVNCSKCWKCLRTLLTFEIGGVLERYADVFDLEVYRHHRSRYMATVLISRDTLLREIVAFAKAREFEFPVSARLLVPAVATRPMVKRYGRRFAPNWLKAQVRKRR